jgi:hypothetical protein
VTEVWKAIDWAPGYLVSSEGRVAGRKRKLLKPSIDSGGYQHVIFYVDGRRVPKKVHRLVLEEFVGPPPDGMEGCHGNGVQTDNRLSNLRWDTHIENVQDRVAHGGYLAQPKGVNHHMARLTDDDVVAIRAKYKKKTEGRQLRDLSAAYGVSMAMIHNIVTRRAWSHIQ